MEEDGFSNNVTLKEEQPAQSFNTVPASASKVMYFDHFSVIINKLAILGMVFCLFATLGQVLTYVAVGIGFMVFIIFMFVATVATLGILLMSEDFRRLWGYVKDFDQVTTHINTFFGYMLTALPYVSAATIVLAITSVICFSRNKHYKHTARTVFAWICTIVAALTLILMLTGGTSA